MVPLLPGPLIANATAKALMRKHPGVVGDIDVDSAYYAQSLFRRMGFVRRRKTCTKVDISAAARKEIEYVFFYEIVSRIEIYSIPDSLVINFDQTSLKLVQCGNSTLAKKNSTNVTIVGAADKRTITGTFSITLSGEFLPSQLIYGGKTKQSLPRYRSATHSKRARIPGLGSEQRALVIMDVFTGQMTSEVKEILSTVRFNRQRQRQTIYRKEI